MEKNREEYRKGHRIRLREKFLEKGIDSLSDVEIIELLLSFGQPRSDVKIQARELIKKYKNLYSVLSASDEELQTISGIGPKNIFGILFVSACYKKAVSQRIKGEKISNHLMAKTVIENNFNIILGNLKDEHVYLLMLDNGNRVQEIIRLSEGTVGRAELYPRKVLENAIKNKAASVILVHNHPSGIKEPSDQDILITKNLAEVLNKVDISILDHIIVTDSDIYSFKENKLL